MKAICLKEPRKLEIVECDMPVASRGEVRIHVRAAGICASDRNIYYGTHPSARYPLQIGRNFVGEVDAIGSDVRGIRLGDHVVVDPVLSCGICDACAAGHGNVCQTLQVMGIHRDGGMAEYVSVPASNVYVVPREWLWERAVMVESFSIAANVLSRTSCTRNDRVLIMGAGPIGLSILMAAKHLGAAVAVADVLEARLNMAKELEADFTLNMNDDGFAQKMLDWTECKGISLSVDVVCLHDFFPLLQKIAAPLGRIAQMGFSEKTMDLIPFEITRKELSIIGSRLNCGMFPPVIEWFSSQKFLPENLVSHSFPYTEVQDAFMLIEESPVNTCKVLLTF